MKLLEQIMEGKYNEKQFDELVITHSIGESPWANTARVIPSIVIAWNCVLDEVIVGEYLGKIKIISYADAIEMFRIGNNRKLTKTEIEKNY